MLAFEALVEVSVAVDILCVCGGWGERDGERGGVDQVNEEEETNE